MAYRELARLEYNPPSNDFAGLTIRIGTNRGQVRITVGNDTPVALTPAEASKLAAAINDAARVTVVTALEALLLDPNLTDTDPDDVRRARY